jgi:hypothetical protein
MLADQEAKIYRLNTIDTIAFGLNYFIGIIFVSLIPPNVITEERVPLSRKKQPNPNAQKIKMKAGAVMMYNTLNLTSAVA